MGLHWRSLSRPARWLRLILLLALLALAAPPRAAVAEERATLVRDITPGPDSTVFEPFGALGDALLFRALGPEGFELWRSDGTAAGTQILRETVPGPGGSNPSPGVRLGERLYFSSGRPVAAPGFQPNDLWRTDGTAAGTELVADLGGGGLGGLTAAGGALFFTVRPAGGGDETLWRSDGTAAGTAPLVTGSAAFARPSFLAGTPSQLFFVALDADGYANLFRTDGSAAGTRQLTSFDEGGAPAFRLTAAGERVFFQVLQEETGNELWTSDGTAADTGLVAELAAGERGVFVSSELAFGERLAFVAFGADGSAGAALFVSDGTAAGTRRIFDAPAGAAALTVIGEELFFASGDRLWASDGTAAGTRLFLDLAALDPPAANPAEIFAFDGAVLFTAEAGGLGRQLWRSDGSPAGTRRLTAIVDAGEDSTGVYGPSVAGDRIFFFASDEARGAELWRLEEGGPPPDRVDDGLLALYTFEEGAGRTVRDRSGVGSPLDLRLSRSSGFSWAADGLRLSGGTALFSRGPARKVIRGARASDEVTVEAWVSPADLEQFSARIMSISGSAARRNIALIQGVYSSRQPTVVSARVRVRRDGPDGGPPLLSPAGALGPRLTHIVFTRAADGATRLYVDGAAVAAGSRVGDLDSWSEGYPLALGGEVGGGRYWRGTYHLVAIYGRALSAAEAEQNFAAGPPAR